MEEFANELSSDEEGAAAEMPVTPSPVKPKPRTRNYKQVQPLVKPPPKPEIVKKKTRSQMRLEKIQAELAELKSSDTPPPKKVSKPSPPTKRAVRREVTNNTIDLTSSVPVTMGFVNLDSDDEDFKAPLVADLSFELENYEMSILIRWNGKYEKFTHRRHQKFEDIMKCLAEREKVDIKNICLDFEEKFLESDETPHSIDYKAGKFICGRVLALDNSKIQKAKKDPNLINIKIQSQSFKKPLSMKIMKNEPMKIVIIKLAEELKCKPEKIHFKFDGDKITGDQTPEDIEMEGGEILDLVLDL